MAPVLSMELITAFNIIVTGFAYQPQLFPVYNSLREANKNTKSAVSSITIALVITFFVNMFLGVPAVFMFGSGVQQSVLTNVNG